MLRAPHPSDIPDFESGCLCGFFPSKLVVHLAAGEGAACGSSTWIAAEEKAGCGPSLLVAARGEAGPPSTDLELCSEGSEPPPSPTHPQRPIS